MALEVVLPNTCKILFDFLSYATGKQEQKRAPNFQNSWEKAVSPTKTCRFPA